MTHSVHVRKSTQSNPKKSALNSPRSPRRGGSGGPPFNTMCLGSTKVSGLNWTSIRLAVYVQQSHTKPDDRLDAVIVDRNSPHLNPFDAA